MNKWFRFILGILISIILLYLSFRKVDFNSILQNFHNVKFFYLLVSFLLGISLLGLRSYRWKLFILEYRDVDLIKFFESTSIGLFFNNILPFRMGDFIQAYTISKKTNLPKSLTFSTVLMERFVDLFPPIIFIIIGSFFIILPKQISILISSIVLLGLILALVIIIRLKLVILKILEKVGSRHKFFLKLKNLFANFYQAIENFKDIKLLIKIIILTLLLWSGYSIGMVLICESLDIKLPSLWAGFLIQAITSLSVAIPSSPGYVGSWEFMGSLSLMVFKIEKSKTLSFALLSHILGMLPVVILGSIFVIKEIALVRTITKEDINET